MEMNIYAVKDLVSQHTNAPFAVPTDRDAIEGFKNVALDESTQISKFPTDFILYKVGVYNSSSMKIDRIEPEQLARALDFKELSKED
jgi:hypothetical protein